MFTGILKKKKDAAFSNNDITRAQIGTPLNMAPEIWEKKPATIFSDVWSYGIIFYHMSTGRLPFKHMVLKKKDFWIVFCLQKL